MAWLAYGGGAGLSPIAPGTMGTLVALPLYWWLCPLSVAAFGLLLLCMALSGIYICAWAAKQLGVHDPAAIVWDEIVGLLLTLWLLPCTWLNLLLGFALFRLFDIVKPWPIRWLDRHVHGGLGIMLDDLVAAVFAYATLRLLLLPFAAATNVG